MSGKGSSSERRRKRKEPVVVEGWWGSLYNSRIDVRGKQILSGQRTLCRFLLAMLLHNGEWMSLEMIAQLEECQVQYATEKSIGAVRKDLQRIRQSASLPEGFVVESSRECGGYRVLVDKVIIHGIAAPPAFDKMRLGQNVIFDP